MLMVRSWLCDLQQNLIVEDCILQKLCWSGDGKEEGIPRPGPMRRRENM